MDNPTAPLLVSADAALVDDVLRLAAAAGVVPEVAADPGLALPWWGSASVVLVGTDVAQAMAQARPRRRPSVHVVARGSVPHDAFRDAVAVGAETVTELPGSEAWLTELLTDAGDGGASPGVTLGVIGGSGGSGATVFATALARSAAAHGPALLVDADPWGAGVDRVLGLETAHGVRWDAMMQATGRLSGRSLREALPRADGLSVLTWPTDRWSAVPAFAMREVLSAGRRGFDWVVVDLPRHGDALGDEVLARCDHIVVVTTLTVAAVTAASRVVRRLPSGVPAHLVTRGGGGNASPTEASAVLGLPLLVAMGDQRGLDEAVNLGAGPLRSRRGALARAARASLAELAA